MLRAVLLLLLLPLTQCKGDRSSSAPPVTWEQCGILYGELRRCTPKVLPKGQTQERFVASCLGPKGGTLRTIVRDCLSLESRTCTALRKCISRINKAVIARLRENTPKKPPAIRQKPRKENR